MASSNFSAIELPPSLPPSDIIVMVTPFGDPPSVRLSLFGTLLLLFTAAVAGNALLCSVVCLERRLRTPMCTFIASMALTDIVQVASSVPRIMANLLGDGGAAGGGGGPRGGGVGLVSVAECTAQMFLMHVSVRAQAFLLALMSVDRYLAVAFPLRYRSLVTNGAALRASAAAAAAACALTCPNVALLVGLDYCRARVLAAVYCSFYSVAFTSCGDVGAQRRYGYATLALATALPACAVALAYALILLECRKAGLRRGQRKALRTCVTHLLAVGAFFASVFFSFASNISFLAGVGAEVSYCLQGLHCIVPALVNPVIYGLGTAEIRRGCVKRFRSRVADGGR
ncbi:olfactory receptor 52Z1P-like [Petromyzon marinus]|uniref:olfactory receptor 52Z1P-like n=1 Tax=Petromyzon marinus TaxID=7757 RepID=UPI003F6EA317